MLALFTLLAVLVLTGADQLFKQLVILHLRDRGPLVLIPRVLQLHYTDNQSLINQNQTI